MPVSGADLTKLRDTHPHNMTVYMSVLTPATIWVGEVNFAHDKNSMFITVDTISGDLADCVSGMTVYITQDYGGADQRIHKRRLLSTGMDTMTVDENGISWAVGDRVEVIEDYELWSVFPNIIIDGDDIIFKKDSGTITYVDQNEFPPPVAIITGERCFIVDEFPIQFTWYGGDSYCIADGATITGYQWSLSVGGQDKGTIIGGSGITDTFTVSFPSMVDGYQDGLWLSLTVTDSNGKTQTTRRLVFIHTRTRWNPYANFTLTELSGDWEQGGWRASIKLHQSLANILPNNAHIILWHEAMFGVPQIDDAAPAHLQVRNYIHNQSEILLEGRIYQEDLEHDVKANTTTTVAVLDIVAQLRKRRMFSISLTYSDAPTTWYEYYLLTVTRALHHLYKWHSTLFDVANVYLPITGPCNDILLAAVDDFGSGTLYTMGDNFARSNSVFAHLCANKMGELYLEVEYNMLSDAGRAAMPTALSIQDSDLTGDPVVKFTRHYDAKAWLVEGSGVYFNGTVSVPLMSVAPSPSPEAMGETELSLERLALSGQTDLNEKVGRAFSIINNEVERLFVNFAGNYNFVDLVPQLVYDANFTAEQTGRAAYAGNSVPRNIRIAYAQRNGTVLVAVEQEAESPSYVGDTVDVPAEPPPATPPVSDPPTYPPPNVPGYGDGFGTVYVMTHTKLGRTRDFSVSSPVWVDITPPGASAAWDFILDPWDPYANGYMATPEGLYKSTDLTAASPTWTLVLSAATINTNMGSGSYTAGYKIIASINVQDYVAFFHMNGGVNTSLFCSYSYDGGASWNISTVDDSVKGFGGGADYVPHLIGGNIVLYAVGHFSTSQIDLRKSSDGGASWASAGTFGVGGGLGSLNIGVSLHCPYNDNDNGDVVYIAVANVVAFMTYDMLVTYDGGANFTVIDAGDVGIGAVVKRHALETYTENRQQVTYYKPTSPTEVYQSVDAGANFTQKAASGMSSRVYASGGFPVIAQQSYTLASAGIYVTVDGGDTYVDKTGDYASAVGSLAIPGVATIGRGVIVPLWLEE